MDIGSDQVGEVILLAREMVEQFTGAEEQFDGLLEGMNEDALADLVALVWVGRGDFEPEEFEDRVRHPELAVVAGGTLVSDSR